MINQRRLFLKAVIALVCAGAIIAGVFLLWKPSAGDSQKTAQNLPAQVFTVTELALYDGTDPAKPIYLGMNGLVYDVTTGREYYQPGGTYHWLAGKDSSADLNLIGGEIIKRKYPVVGAIAP